MGEHRRRGRLGPRAVAAAASVAIIAFGVVASSDAQLPVTPLNDLAALGQGTGQTPAKAAVQRNAEPPFTATPLVHCLSGSRPEPGVDGRVPEGSAANSLHCNSTLVAHQGSSGGFKVYRYVDAQGHTCAYYDTALLFPLNALNLASTSVGVKVLDMDDPAHPKVTDTLTEAPMLSPHESLNLNTRRELLAAVDGNPSTYPGLVSIYSVSNDCRHPVLQKTGLLARFGHESGFSPDGRTFYATGTAVQSITAIDVTDPQDPHPIWQGNVQAHGMSISDDGNRAYVADPTGHNMAILDTSQVQARKPNPQVREISRLTWTNASIPQNAIPFSENGHPYVLEFDEYTQSTLNPAGNPDAVGAGHIVDIGDEAHPRVIANLRLQIDQPAEHAAAKGDPGTNNPAQGYAAHYCNVPTRVNPKVVACSFIASGLRVFDISKLTKPKEIAYYVAPPEPRSENGFTNSDFAMSQPVILPSTRQVWYTDGTTGFYVLRVDPRVWPAAAGACQASRSRRVSVRRGGVTLVRARVMAGGKPVRRATLRLRGKGVNRRASTNSHGVVTFRVRPRRNGRLTVSGRLRCSARLRVRVTRAQTRVSPRFTG